ASRAASGGKASRRRPLIQYLHTRRAGTKKASLSFLFFRNDVAAELELRLPTRSGAPERFRRDHDEHGRNAAIIARALPRCIGRRFRFAWFDHYRGIIPL